MALRGLWRDTRRLGTGPGYHKLLEIHEKARSRTWLSEAAGDT